MKLIISKLIRIYKNKNIPNCFAFQYLPKSLDDTCNCSTFCKYPPKGNVKSPINLNTNLPLTYFKKIKI